MDTDLITEYRGHNVEEFDMLLVELLEAVPRAPLVLVGRKVVAEAAGGDARKV